ncbi:hypothetical protein OG897_25000 [Streptomyces sp. NBC_00237]|uniref:hypothetical protein n=1 Tax=Streptomyces sp. NBC_00237 TaxID=2975687 RepID=UPI00225A1CDA|nr:hypothetical protein [Streptomyces sp. NBC_00237]MCX5204700.1 hypothetical protein [Streptomyces sp. NBC_00237]
MTTTGDPCTTGSADGAESAEPDVSVHPRVLGGEEWGLVLLVLAVVPYQLFVRSDPEKAWLIYLAACAGAGILLTASLFMKWKPGRFTVWVLALLATTGIALALAIPGRFPF